MLGFLTFMLPRRATLGDPYLLGVHAAGGEVWVWGSWGQTGLTYPLPVRVWNGVAWASHDRVRVTSAEELASGYGDGAGGAWTSGYHFSLSTVAYWNGSAWADELTGGRKYLTGTGPGDLYAIVGAPNSPLNTFQYYYNNGGGWGSKQSLTPGGITYSPASPVIIGDGIPTNQLDSAGVRAVTCPDGAVIVTGGGAETGTLHRYAFVWMLSGGTVSEVLLRDQEPAGATVRFDGLWAADNSHVYLIQGAGLFGGTRTLYLWDRTPGDPWVSQTVPSWGCGSALHGVSPSDWWMIDDGANALRVSHWDGATFTDYSLPDPLSPASGTTRERAIFAVATDDVWIVGSSFNSTTGHNNGPVWHWDGAAWTVQTVFTS